MSFAQLKKNRSNNLDRLNQQLQKLGSSPITNYADEREWKPDVDKAGNGYAVIRFLPAPDGEDMPFVRIWDHGFQGPGGWYIENSLTTIGQTDPVSEYNSMLWNSGNEKDKEVARKQKRRLNYIANIVVLKDPTRPDNEGKVFIYKFGKKIFDKINDLMNPQFQDEEPVNPFDFWEGANFKLKIRNFEGYRNYDKSEFDSPAPLSDDDENLEAIYKKIHSLQEFIAPNNFKSYDELKAKFYRVIGLDGGLHAPKTTAEDDEVETKSYVAPKEAAAPAMAQASPSSDDEDDDMSFFKKLAED